MVNRFIQQYMILETERDLLYPGNFTTNKTVPEVIVITEMTLYPWTLYAGLAVLIVMGAPPGTEL